MVYVTLFRPNIMQKLDRINIMITRNSGISEDLQSNIDLFLLELPFRMLQKLLIPAKTCKHLILLTNKRTLEDYFYIENVSHRAIA